MNHIHGLLHFNTNYNFKVFRGEKLIQEENTHNVILRRVLTQKIRIAGSHDYRNFGRELRVGNGTGTPADTDTGLFSHLWTINRESMQALYTDDETGTTAVRYTFTIPATTSYVGTITECGLYGYFSNPTYYTHALIKDAEGNPISIEKTDLDKVIITIDIALTVKSAEADVLMSPLSKTIFPTLLSYNDSSTFDFFNCTSYYADYNKHDIVALVQNPMELLNRQKAIDYYYSSEGKYQISSYEGVPRGTYKTVVESDNVRRCTGRVNQDAYPAGSVAYIKGLMFLGAFIVKLPNERFFPSYTLQGINVGVASGDETQMLCPLDYFVEGSETIYQNGTALTRGVDYTIDAYNNHRGLIELTEGNDAIITGGVRGNHWCVGNKTRIFRARCNGFTESGSYTRIFSVYDTYGISTASPVQFDMQEQKTINFLRVPTNANYKYTIYTSEDGVDYVERYTHTFVSGESYLWEFEPLTARYFQVAINSSSGGSVEHIPTYSQTSVANPALYYALGFKTDGMIKFTQPLAAGDVITMDCSMDLPYKTENNVIDYDFSVSL